MTTADPPPLTKPPPHRGWLLVATNLALLALLVFLYSGAWFSPRALTPTEVPVETSQPADSTADDTALSNNRTIATEWLLDSTTRSPQDSKPRDTNEYRTTPLKAASISEAFARLGKTVGTVFPEDEELQLSSDSMVFARKAMMYDQLPCWGDDDEESRHARYDVVMLPIGCFGDIPGPHCTSTSCFFGRALANATYCARRKFGAFLGDNFYPNGLRSRNDGRFERDLNAKFLRHSALRMRYYAMAGNHDLLPETQLRNDHPYWFMPSLNYTDGPIHFGGTSVQVFVVDTHWGFERNDPHMEEQARGLEEALKRSKATWKVVMSHEPVFCFEDFTHNRGLVDFVHPLLIKYKVQFFVAAHVHGVFLHPVEGGYHQLISAGYANSITAKVKPKRPNGYYHLGRGATAIFFNKTFADVTAFMPDGSIVFRHRVGVKVDPAAPIGVTAVAEQSRQTLFTVQNRCESFLPASPRGCG